MLYVSIPIGSANSPTASAVFHSRHHSVVAYASNVDCRTAAA
jgi:hypothetical protein